MDEREQKTKDKLKLIATSEYYNSTHSGTGSIYFDGLYITGQSVTISGTATNSNLSLVKSPVWDDCFYFNGLAFDTAKKAKAYENMAKSREVSHNLSFFTPQTRYVPPRCTKPRLSALSLKQRTYNKRKKFKEKLGLKH